MVPLKPACKVTGFVVMAVGAPLLVFITVWSLRQDQLLAAEITTLSRGKHGNTAENNLNQVLMDEGTTDHMGPIHYFEVQGWCLLHTKKQSAKAIQRLTAMKHLMS